MKKFLALSHSDVVFIMLINVKMPTIVGILIFMSRMNLLLSWVEHEKSFITSESRFFLYLLHMNSLSTRNFCMHFVVRCQNQHYQTILSRILSRVLNSLDPDQDRHFVGPDLHPNCLQRLSADKKMPLAGSCQSWLSHTIDMCVFMP